jgi:hypothetical protein
MLPQRAKAVGMAPKKGGYPLGALSHSTASAVRTIAATAPCIALGTLDFEDVFEP